MDVDRLQRWLDDHGLEGSDRGAAQRPHRLDRRRRHLRYAQDAISFAQDAALSVILLLFSVVLVVVISIYMLLDMPRLESSIDRRFLPHGACRLRNGSSGRSGAT